MQLRVKKDGRVFKFMTETILKETDRYTAQISKFSYKPCTKCMHKHCYMLTPLGFLNGLIGLELIYEDESTSLDSSSEDSGASSSR